MSILPQGALEDRDLGLYLALEADLVGYQRPGPASAPTLSVETDLETKSLTPLTPALMECVTSTSAIFGFQTWKSAVLL